MRVGIPVPFEAKDTSQARDCGCGGEDSEASNGWIRKVLETESKRGKQAAIERGRSISMSLSLGRDFGESVESYAKRNPDAGEFFTWFKQYQS